MEVVHHRCKVSPEEGEDEDDVISSMPDNVTSNIMDRLPLQDAVGTSILSTSWRLKWTLLTQLRLDYYFFDSLQKQKVHFDKTDINRLLLHLKQLTNFILCVPNDLKVDDEDIYHWILFLSRIRGFNELTLRNSHPTPLKLPTHLFSCLDLKHLMLHDYVFPSYFHGFPKLVTLHLHDNASIQDHRYGESISKCPLLEILKIKDSKLRGGLKLVEIAQLENLKMLSLPLCLLDNMTMLKLSTVFQYFSLLPKLQELYLTFNNCKFLPEDFTQNPVSTTFPSLKTLTLWEIDFSSVSTLSCAFGMLFGCTSLQTLFINVAIYQNEVPLPAIFSPEVDCKTLGQLQLQDVRLFFIRGLENEVWLIKYILACSPMLKSIRILLDESIKSNENEKYKLASKLLKLHRASPIAEVIF